MTIEEIILPDGTPARKSTFTWNGDTTVIVTTPEILVHFIANADHEGFEVSLPSHWSDVQQRIIPGGSNHDDTKNIEHGADAGRLIFWRDMDGKWWGRSEPIDYRWYLKYEMDSARINLGNESLHPVLDTLKQAEDFLRSTTHIGFFVDPERLRAKDLCDKIRVYNDQQWSARMAGSVRRQKDALAEARGGKFIEKLPAQRIMADAQYKTRKRRNEKWVEQFIKYQDKWLRICRVDLSNQVASTIYSLQGVPPTYEQWAKSIVYGVVATDEDWYIVDSTSDG